MFIFPYQNFFKPLEYELRITQIIFIKYSELYPDSKRSVVFIKKNMYLIILYLIVKYVLEAIFKLIKYGTGFLQSCCGLEFGLCEDCWYRPYAPRMGPLQWHPVAHLSLCTPSKVDTPKHSICWTGKGGEGKHFWVSVKCLLGKEIWKQWEFV